MCRVPCGGRGAQAGVAVIEADTSAHKGFCVGYRGLPNAEGEVELDAAMLAAKYSKAAQSGTVKVNLCRARQVSKPQGAKAGLVQLSGNVITVRVDWRKERHRLERLEAQLSGGGS